MLRRAFTMLEMLLVIGLLGLFASVVIPGMSGAQFSSAPLVEGALDADLRLARTEAIARARAVVFVCASDGSAWWIADNASPDIPFDGTLREFGRGTLNTAARATLHITTGDGSSIRVDNKDARVVARFDALGSRDDNALEFVLHNAEGSQVGAWSLAAGRTRLHRE